MLELSSISWLIINHNLDDYPIKASLPTPEVDLKSGCKRKPAKYSFSRSLA